MVSLGHARNRQPKLRYQLYEGHGNLHQSFRTVLEQPGNVPITTGSCMVSGSRQKPTTQLPSTMSGGVCPIPFIEEVVVCTFQASLPTTKEGLRLEFFFIICMVSNAPHTNTAEFVWVLSILDNTCKPNESISTKKVLHEIIYKEKGERLFPLDWRILQDSNL